MMLIDSHCHLEYEGLAEDQQGALDRARAAGVGGFLNISTRQSEWARVVGTAEREPDVWASIGIHPHEADQHADLGAAALLEAAGHPRVIGLGAWLTGDHRMSLGAMTGQLPLSSGALSSSQPSLVEPFAPECPSWRQIFAFELAWTKSTMRFHAAT